MSAPSAREHGDQLVRAAAYEVVVALYVSIALSVLAFVGLGGEFQDLYVRLRPSAPTSGQVALVTIGEDALYLWDPANPHPDVTPRGMLAEIVRLLDAAGARVIVLDVLMPTAEPGDDALAAAARAHGAVVVAEQFAITEPQSGLEFVPGTSLSLGDAVVPAFANLQAEEPLLFSGEMLVRRAPLVRRVTRARLTGTFPMDLVGGEQDDATVLPSLALAAAWLERAREEDPHANAADLFRELQEGCQGPCAAPADARFPALPGPLDEPLEINFRGSERRDGIPAIRAAEILRVAGQSALMASLGAPAPAEIPPRIADLVRGKVVVVGRVDGVDEDGADRFVTPYSFPVMLHADMAGCRIHAQIVDTMLSGRQIRPVGGFVAWALAAVVVAGVWFTRRASAAHHALGWLVVSVLLLAAGVLVFRWTDGVALDLAPPLGASLVALVATHVWGWARQEATG